MPTINLQVAASDDNANEAQDGTGFSTASAPLQINSHTSAANRTNGGFRFTGVAIPVGSTIVSAFLELYVTATATDDPNVEIYGNLVPDAADFLTEADVTSRVLTLASVDWVATAVGVGFVASPDISPVIQEVVDQGSWASGNAVVILPRGKSDLPRGFRVRNYATSSAEAAKLTIEYTEPEPPPAPAVGAGAALHPEDLGITLAIFAPTIDPGVSYEPKGRWLKNQEYFTSLEFTLNAQGGYGDSVLTMTVNREEADSWLEDGLGKTLVIYNNAQQVRYEGFVNEVTASIANLDYNRGPLMGVSNRVWLSYTPVLDDSVNPPITGAQMETPIAENDASQVRFGILERIYNGGTVLTALAEQTRDTVLKEAAWPISSGGLAIGPGVGQVRVELKILGFKTWLGQYYVDDSAVGTKTLSGKIEAALAADINGLFSTDYARIAVNNALITASEQDRRSAANIISDAVSRGDVNFDPYTFGIYAGRQAVYAPEPTEAYYEHRLGDLEMRIQKIADASRVHPWDVLPARYIFLANHMAGRVRSGLPIREDPRYLFIESVTYRAPWSVDINGVRISDLPQYMAQLGAGSL